MIREWVIKPFPSLSPLLLPSFLLFRNQVSSPLPTNATLLFFCFSYRFPPSPSDSQSSYLVFPLPLPYPLRLFASSKGLPVEKVKFLAILASQQGLDALQKAFPNLQIYVCALDPTLTNKGYIS
jgi:hypothetical protein